MEQILEIGQGWELDSSTFVINTEVQVKNNSKSWVFILFIIMLVVVTALCYLSYKAEENKRKQIPYN